MYIPWKLDASSRRGEPLHGRCRNLALPCSRVGEPCRDEWGGTRGILKGAVGIPRRGLAAGNEGHRFVSSSRVLRRICKPAVQIGFRGELRFLFTKTLRREVQLKIAGQNDDRRSYADTASGWAIFSCCRGTKVSGLFPRCVRRSGKIDGFEGGWR
jgi:hypothetical protein